MRVDLMRFRTGRWLALAPLLLALGAAPGEKTANEPTPVTAATLFEHEHLWPYRVALIGSWKPPGREVALPAGSTGVLIRVEAGGVARIDFASDGKYEVPIGQTDLVENANRVARGELGKEAPNFLYAIGARLLDSSSDPLTALRPDTIADRRRFVCVFADPGEKPFADLAAALRRLKPRDDTATILFPQGKLPDVAVAEQLHKLEWPVPFVYHFLSEPYTHTLLREGTALPTVMLTTNEGRVLYQGTWTPSLVSELNAAFEAASGEKTSP
jgi:hypothetical protein